MDITTKRNELLKTLMVLQQEVTKYHGGFKGLLNALEEHRTPSWTVAPKREMAKEAIPERPHPKM